MTELFVDYSAGKLTSSAIRAANFQGAPITGVIRYIDHPSLLGTKHTSVAEYTDLVSAGIKVQLVFEVGTNDSAGGYAAGVSYAQRAKAGADLLGYTGVIFFCNDSPTLSSVVNWQAYLTGAVSVLGKSRVGAYGFRNAIDSAWGLVSAYWQCGALSAVRSGVNSYQWNNGNMSIAGIVCDVNYVYSYYTPAGPGPSPISGSSEDPSEEYTVQIPAGTNVRQAIPCDGKTKICFQAGFGQPIDGHVWFIGDTKPGAGPQYLGSSPQLVHIDSDKPGPVTVPDNCRVVQVELTCAVPFTAWCATS